MMRVVVHARYIGHRARELGKARVMCVFDDKPPCKSLVRHCPPGNASSDQRSNDRKRRNNPPKTKKLAAMREAKRLAAHAFPTLTALCTNELDIANNKKAPDCRGNGPGYRADPWNPSTTAVETKTLRYQYRADAESNENATPGSVQVPKKTPFLSHKVRRSVEEKTSALEMAPRRLVRGYD
jgi:hypothetical protein